MGPRGGLQVNFDAQKRADSSALAEFVATTAFQGVVAL